MSVYSTDHWNSISCSLSLVGSVAHGRSFTSWLLLSTPCNSLIHISVSHKVIKFGIVCSLIWFSFRFFLQRKQTTRSKWFETTPGPCLLNSRIEEQLHLKLYRFVGALAAQMQPGHCHSPCKRFLARAIHLFWFNNIPFQWFNERPKTVCLERR